MDILDFEPMQPATETVAEQPVGPEQAHTPTAEMPDLLGALIIATGAVAIGFMTAFRDKVKGPRNPA